MLAAEKTEVIANRVAGLVKDGVSKEAIIAFSFTQKSAEELKARIRRHLEELLPDDPSLGDMYVGTIHSFSLKLLKEIDPSYRNFEVMDDARQAALIMSNYYYTESSDLGIGVNKLSNMTARGTYWATMNAFINTLSVVHQRSIEHSQIPDKDVRKAVVRYEKIAYRSPNYFLDFDYIISSLIERLKEDEQALSTVRSRFNYLVVDEYQDVDEKQEELIRIISDTGKEIWVTTVGDDDQAIYGWRGAKVENILIFAKDYPDVTSISLRYNFRSTHCIVDLANHAIRKIPSTKRISKNMIAKNYDPQTDSFPEAMAEFGDVQVRRFDTEEDEATWIAEQVEALRGTLIGDRDNADRGIDYSDFAILLRSVKSNGANFLEALRRKGIPAVVKGTGGLFEFDESQLILAAFSLLARKEFIYESGGEYHYLHERETRQFVRDKIEELTDAKKIISSNSTLFLEWIEKKKAELDKRNLERSARGRLAHRIYPQSIFHDMLGALGIAEGEPWADDALYNLGKISELITHFESVHQWVRPGDIGSLCLYLGGWASGRVDEGGLEESGYINAVQIMTVHAAKGLEWPVVFVPRVCSYAFPSSRRNSGPEVLLPKNLFDPKQYASGDEGERRLWYVALTRSRKFLYITSPDKTRKRPTDYFKEVENIHSIVQRSGLVAERIKGDPTPAEDGGFLATSYSELNHYWRCPYEYSLRNLMHFGPGVSESYGYGQQVHNILAELHLLAKDGQVLTEPEIEDLVDKRFHLRYTNDGSDFKPLTALRESAKKSIKRYIDSYPISSEYIIEAEKGFEFVDKESNVLISGAIDLVERIVHEPDGERKVPVCLVDFKTHNWSKKREAYESVKRAVEDQLRLYSVAAGQALNFDANDAKAHILSPKPPPDEMMKKGVTEVINVDVSELKKREILEKVSKTVAEIRETRIESKRFAFRGCESGACEDCDFRVICPGYKIWDKTDDITPRPPSLEEGWLSEVRIVEKEWWDAGKKPES